MMFYIAKLVIWINKIHIGYIVVNRLLRARIVRLHPFDRLRVSIADVSVNCWDSCMNPDSPPHEVGRSPRQPFSPGRREPKLSCSLSLGRGLGWGRSIYAGSLLSVGFKRSSFNLKTWRLELKRSSFNLETCSFELERSSFNLGTWRLELKRSSFNLKTWRLELKRSSFNLKTWRLELKRSSFNLETWSLELERSSFNLETWSLELERSSFNLEKRVNLVAFPFPRVG